MSTLWTNLGTTREAHVGGVSEALVSGGRIGPSLDKKVRC